MREINWLCHKIVKLLVTSVLGGLTLISLKAVNSVKITNLMNIKYNEYLLNSEYLKSSLYDFQGHTVHLLVRQKSLEVWNSIGNIKMLRKSFEWRPIHGGIYIVLHILQKPDHKKVVFM